MTVVMPVELPALQKGVAAALVCSHWSLGAIAGHLQLREERVAPGIQELR
jgi:hypothetical protein